MIWTRISLKKDKNKTKKTLKIQTLFIIPTNELYQRIYACVGGCCSPPGVVEGRAVGLAVDFLVVVVFVDVVIRVVDFGVIVVLGGGNDSLTTIVILGSTGSILTFHSQKPSL